MSLRAAAGGERGRAREPTPWDGGRPRACLRGCACVTPSPSASAAAAPLLRPNRRRFSLPDEGLRGRLELTFFDSHSRGIACDLDSKGKASLGCSWKRRRALTYLLASEAGDESLCAAAWVGWGLRGCPAAFPASWDPPRAKA